jgi:hypothetical protein
MTLLQKYIQQSEYTMQFCLKIELHRQVHDIVGLRITTKLEDAYEAQGENIMVDGYNTAKFVSPS